MPFICFVMELKYYLSLSDLCFLSGEEYRSPFPRFWPLFAYSSWKLSVLSLSSSAASLSRSDQSFPDSSELPSSVTEKTCYKSCRFISLLLNGGYTRKVILITVVMGWYLNLLIHIIILKQFTKSLYHTIPSPVWNRLHWEKESEFTDSRDQSHI